MSVLILSYNQEQFLRECIDSVLSQDYPNVQIVVSDDGSTSNVADFLRDCAQQHPGRMEVVLHPVNTGITANSNRGLALCRGKYVTWLGRDDLYMPSKVSRQVQYMEAHPECTICYHNLEIFDSDTGRTLGTFNNNDNAYSGDVRTVIRHGTFNGALANMWRADHVPSHGFEPSIKMASDWLFWVEVLAQGGEIHYLNEVLGRYRRHAGNVTKRRFILTHMEHLRTGVIITRRYPRYWRDVLFRYTEGAQSVIRRFFEAR